MDASQIGKHAWGYAGVLQNAGSSCFEHVAQLTLLLFPKMADQFTQPPQDRPPLAPHEPGWRVRRRKARAAHLGPELGA